VVFMLSIPLQAPRFQERFRHGRKQPFIQGFILAYPASWKGPMVMG